MSFIIKSNLNYKQVAEAAFILILMGAFDSRIFQNYPIIKEWLVKHRSITALQLIYMLLLEHEFNKDET